MGKKIFTPFFIVFITLFSNYVSSQENCDDGSFFLTNGSKWVYNDYRKDKFVSTTTTFLDSVLFHDDSTEFFTHDVTKYIKAEDTSNQTVSKGKFICKNNKIYVSTDYVYVDSFSSFNMVVNYTYLEIPTNLRVGQNLEGMTYYLSEKYYSVIYDRKVEKQETIQTAAGKFNCFLITYKSKSNTYGLKFNSIVKQWYSPLVGIVKTETYNKKGKLKYKKVLTEFSK